MELPIDDDGAGIQRDMSDDTKGAASDLAGDLFWNLYDRAPSKAAEVPAERDVNDALINWAQDGQQWQTMRDSTVGNLPAAVGASQLMWNLLATDEAYSEALQLQERAEQARQEAQAERMTQQNMQAGGLDAQAQAAGALADLKEADADQLFAEASMAIEGLAGDVVAQASIAAAAKKAGEEAGEIATVMAGYGLGPGDAVRQDASQALEFLNSMTDKIRAIAQLAGRVRGIALSAGREKVQYGPVLTKVGMTKDLTRVMPSELALLRPDVPDWLRATQLAKLVEGGLLGWMPGGDRDQQGPFVAMVDISPSMWGEREIMCKGVALGLAQAARAKGREYILATFASGSLSIKRVTSQDSWQRHLEWAEYTAHGGTDFDLALGEALEQLDNLGKPDSADLMFLSDGEGHVTQRAAMAWKAYAQAHGSRLLYVPVCPEVHSWDHYNLPEYCDQVIPIDEDSLLGDGAETIARQVARYW
jgi:uncharacterized protein with von Willebrand factor type A (vWA) domain